MQRKIKVLLHSMTFMRDFGFVYSLSKILERLGCDVFVCSNTDYTSLPMRLWNPDVVFYVTIGRTGLLRAAFPNSKLVLWNAESCRFDTYPPFELEIASDPEKYRDVSRVLLWGEGTREIILDHARKNTWKWITDDLENFDRKFVVVGHPRIDLAQYGTKHAQKRGHKVKIGIIGLCASINNGKHSIPEMLLNDKETDDNFNTSKEFSFQSKYYQLIKKMTLTLGTDKYEYNLRPYFLENIHNYESTALVKSGKLKIDDSIEFTTWLKTQDLVIGAVSTTMYLVAAAKKPYISVDHMLERPMDRIVFAHEYLSGIPEHCPKTYDQFAEMVKNYASIPLTFESSDILKKQHDRYLKAKEDLPVLLLMARQIISSSSDIHNTSGLPTSLCDLFNRLRTSYAEFRGLGSKAENYSHFSRSIIPKAESEFGDVINNILESALPEQLKEISCPR